MITNEQNKEVGKLNYYKLSYIGKFSKECQSKISEMCDKYCKNLKIRLSFSLLKTGSLFSSKDRIFTDQKSFVVYLFSCAGCNASYIGETTRQIMVRVNEHLEKDKESIVFNHLKKFEKCKETCDRSCFEILDQAQTKFVLKIKQSIHIEQKNPTLNKQKKPT